MTDPTLTTILAHLPDGRIRYLSDDGEVTGWQVGIYAVRDSPCEVDMYDCIQCSITRCAEFESPVYVVDDLNEQRAAGAFVTLDAARVFADSLRDYPGAPTPRNHPWTRWCCETRNMEQPPPYHVWLREQEVLG